MIYTKLSNRRATWRHRFIIPSVLHISSTEKQFSHDECSLIDINIDGLQVMFRNTTFFYHLLEESEKEDFKISIEFSFQNEILKYPLKLDWVNMEDTGEKSVLVNCGLRIQKDSSEYNKELHLNLLFSMMMENIYIP